MSNSSEHDQGRRGLDRRGFLKTAAGAAGAGIIWSMSGGRLGATALADVLQTDPQAAPAGATADFSFVQISDTHIGFDLPPNKHPKKTFKEAVAKINGLTPRPAFVVHTGDHVHLGKVGEFDAVKQLLGTIRTTHVFNVPGEHDIFADGGKLYQQFFGNPQGTRYYSFDWSGVHFLALSTVESSLGSGVTTGLGLLGPEQLSFIQRDLKGVSSDTPLVIFAHIPILPVYTPWGWATRDAGHLLQLVKRFRSVTALNGHIHQVVTRTRGNVVMHTGDSTAYPLHPPGHGTPTPLVVAPAILPRRIGIREARFAPGASSPRVQDESLAGGQ
ncbi:MAG: metallophosphoesterase [Chloroflexi bacterium]|nr:metallophosphoesterase [Chloroflexota bacterium]